MKVTEIVVPVSGLVIRKTVVGSGGGAGRGGSGLVELSLVVELVEVSAD